MIYGYIRVSTDTQTVEHQRFAITQFAEHENVQMDGWIEETISGTKNYNKRALGKLLRKIKKGDTIICTELSRLGRNLFMIMDILHLCMTKGCHVWTIKDHYRLGEDIQSKVLAFAFGLSAEIERELISMRTKEALQLKRQQGVHIGRKQGNKTQRDKRLLFKHDREIRAMRKAGYSFRTIAEKIHHNRDSVRLYYKDFIEPFLEK